MCQMSMKLPAMFDQNRPHTLDQIVAKHIPMKNDLKKKNATQKKFEQGSLSIWCAAEGDADADADISKICGPQPYEEDRHNYSISYTMQLLQIQIPLKQPMHHTYKYFFTFFCHTYFGS